MPDSVERVGAGRNSQYINTICCGFDIETTNDDATQTAYMYIWQFAINGAAFYGRDWDSFFCFLSILRERLTGAVVIFVHNLPFEMSFLLPRLWQAGRVKRVFARDERDVLEVVTTDNFIFRDTAALTNMSLAALARNYCHTQKLVGDLDYTIRRNSTTPLTAKELAYCENDVIILSEYAERLHREYTCNGLTIPYTSTGIVRRMIKQRLKGWAYRDAQKRVARLYPQTVNQYNYTMQYLYRGAFCHAQTAICGQTLHDVHSHDLKSAYPAEMCHRLYPSTPFRAINPDSWQQAIRLGRAVIMLCKFYGIQATGAHVLESRHKIISEEGAEYDNGRLYYADMIEVLITEVDYKIYSIMYKWDRMEVIGAKAASKDFLPDYLLRPLFDVYQQKEDIGKAYKADKSNRELQALYQSTKGKLNSFYGMCVARLNLEEAVYNGTWTTERNTSYSDEVAKSVLSPYWGIYITAYTRLTICSAIVALGNKAYYSDTDSIKHSAPFDYFDRFNERMEEINRAMCAKYKLDFSIFKNLGKFDYEETYDHFKTLGAKRYITDEGGEVTCTVAGLPKDTFRRWATDIGGDRAFEEFAPDLSFEVSGKNAHKYSDEVSADICGEIMHEYGCCYIYGVGFRMRVDSGFLLAINKRRRLEP